MDADNLEPVFKYTSIALGIILGVFIFLKLIGVVNWSWWFVFAPFFLDVLLFIVSCVCFFFVYLKES